MQPVNEFNFYELASSIHPLTEATQDTKYSEVWFKWIEARRLLNETFVQRRPLSISRPAATSLYGALSQFVPDDFDAAVAKVPKANDPGAVDPLLGYLHFSVVEAAKNFETVLAAELQSMDTYFVSQKGSYKTADLIEHAHYCFPPSVRQDLPDQTKIDFDQAGKCLAFDTATASAFHILRGTEAVIRKYYQQVTGAAPKQKMRNWGAYRTQLIKSGADAKVTDLMEHIRVAYRNPVLHPEDNLTEEQALVLFGVCVSFIVLMDGEIKRLSAKSAAPLAFPASGAISATS
jgi:hypothetical protein